MPKKLPPGQARLNRYRTQYRNNARARSIDWALSSEEFEELVSRDCFYCGTPPAELPLHPSWKTHSTARANGIDRSDSSVGYTVDNCRTCCSLCNQMKSDRPAETYIAQAIRVAGRFAAFYRDHKHAFS